MADNIVCFSVCYLLLILYGSSRYLHPFSVVFQFVVCWLVIELAFFHAVLIGLILGLTLLDLSNWGFSTLLGVAIGLLDVSILWGFHRNSLKTDFSPHLKQALGEDFEKNILPERQQTLNHEISGEWKKPFSFKNNKIETLRNITYGPNDRNTLDLHRPATKSDKPRPVMLQIHGGGWVLGFGDRQGLPLRNKLVEAGWIYVAINYRLSPKDQFPAHIVDCKQSLHWIKQHIAEYGGDPDFVLCTGGSAGGHLCSLLALTANRHQDILQPGFEQGDTSVNGCLPMYGVYDFCGSNPETAEMSFEDFLVKQKVMPMPLEQDRAFWQLMSPVEQVTAERCPFMVINGINDTLTLVENSRFFVNGLKQQGNAPCVYAEVEKSPHGFDVFYSPRCIAAINAMHAFSEWLYSNYLTAKNDR